MYFTTFPLRFRLAEGRLGSLHGSRWYGVGMAVLRVSGDTNHPLGTESIIGRSRRCEIRLEGASVSSRHALMRWTGSAWELRDLGSRNGTWVDGTRLAPGVRVVVTEQTAVRVGDVVLTIVDDGPPDLFVRESGGSGLVMAQGGLISLPPGGDDPCAQLYAGPDGRWMLEQDEQLVPAPEQVVVGEQRWEVFLPDSMPDTVALSTPAIGNVGLHFKVSADEEWTQMVVTHPSGDLPLQARAHHYLLLTLARHRMADHSASAEGEGWVEMETLEHMLRSTRAQINLQIFRARKQLSQYSVGNAASLIERRNRFGLLRIGVDRLSTERL